VKQPGFLQSLKHAWNGFRFTVRTQQNARIHLCVGVIVISLAVWLNVGLQNLSVLVLTIGAVLASETINTTVEAIVDLLSPDWHERAGIAKDVAAAAVLIMSITAAVVGALILGPALWFRFFS
jgi:undecaprenol kinase/diacylglycerol kinase (ATP)